MDAIMKLAESTEEQPQEFDFSMINPEKFKQFHSKVSVWEFNNISREEYINKSEAQKKNLILIFYKHMDKGIYLSFVLCSVFVLSLFSFSKFSLMIKL